MNSEISSIIERITERYETPRRIGSMCESTVFYRVELLNEEELEILASYITERIINVCSPVIPDLIINLLGGNTTLAEHLSRELAPPGGEIEIILYSKLNPANGHGKRLKNANVLLVSDVITTARSCLEAHSKVTLAGSSVLCWCSLIDRTFGPGPVPVVAAMNGEPIRLLTDL